MTNECKRWGAMLQRFVLCLIKQLKWDIIISNKHFGKHRECEHEVIIWRIILYSAVTVWNL